MTNPQPIDFTKVETLRRHMLLTTGDMSKLFGVSRMTYYGWVKGKPIRKTNDANVRRMLKKLLNIMGEHHWPTPDVIVANSKERMQRLTELLGD